MQTLRSPYPITKNFLLLWTLAVMTLTSGSPLGRCLAPITVSPSPVLNRTLSPRYDNDMGYYFTFFSNFAYCYNNSNCNPTACQWMALPPHIRVHWALTVPRGPYDLRMVFLLDSKNKAIITTFAGTEGNIQLIDELLSSGLSDSGLHQEAPEVFVDGIEIVSYFQDNLLVIVQQFSRVYENLLEKYPDYNHYFTGHSLGGAFASILGMLSSAGNKELPGQNLLVTLGQPGVGNELYASSVDRFIMSYRMVYHKDPVTYIPSWTTHHGVEVWYYPENCGFLSGCDSGLCVCRTCARGDYALCSASLAPQMGKSDHSGYWEVLQSGFCGSWYSTYNCYY